MIKSTTLTILLFAAQLLLAAGSSTEAPFYTVIQTTTAPIIDGVVTAGEWDGASVAADRFVNLRADTSDTHNIRFQAMWDDQNLYLLGQSDYDGFVPGRELSSVASAPNSPSWDGTGYNYNFYIDPNRDGERTWTTPVAIDTVDGYQIAWDVHEGFAARRPTPGSPNQSLRDPLDANGQSVNDYFGGMHLEAHVNSPWGNQGEWDLNSDGPNQNYRDDALPGLIYAANADNTDVNGTGRPGHVWEWSISWQSLNATDPNTGQFPENGLYAVDGPSVGEVWGFEMAIVTNDQSNFLPSWSEPKGGDPTRGSSFAPWGTVGHGRLVFEGAPNSQVVPEPNSLAVWAILATIVVGVAGIRRRQTSVATD